MTRQPKLATPLVKAAQKVMGSLDGEGNAPSTWVQAGAVARHAELVGLVGPGSIRGQLTDLAGQHKRLTYWGELAGRMPADAEAAIEALWTEHDLWPRDEFDRTLWFSYPLGDLYQSLSVEAVKGRAMCQTPWWVTELLLHISYDRAKEVWGYPRVIDPSCGCGHTLVESYMAARAYRLYRGRDDHAALDSIHGVDLDPHAAATAAYRLIVLAYAQLRHKGGSVADLPVNVSQGDSLLSEDEPLLGRGQYHVVVANPPYITVKDAGLNEAIRAKYPEVAYRQYSLALPFHQLMMELLVPGGWCAQLTGNSFMKREFGEKYVENYLTGLDAQWIIDTSGAYIPGHGTPTVIMCHRNQAPTSDEISFLGCGKGEPSLPAEPSRGVVWTAIKDAVHWRESLDRLGRSAPTEEVPESVPVTQDIAEVFALIAPPEEPVKRMPKPRAPRSVTVVELPGQESLFDLEAA